MPNKKTCFFVFNSSLLSKIIPMTNNKGVLGIVILVFLVIGYFAFFSGEKKKRRVESKKLSMLLGGGSGGNGEDGSFEKKRGRRNNNSSVIDSEFGKSGLPQFVEEETNSPEGGQQGDIPINPQTGKPWEEDAMQQFDELRKLFADNDLIPRRATKEDQAKQAQLAEKWNKAQAAVSSGTFTRDDLDTHFSHQKKVVEDRMQIIEYLMEAQKEDGEVDKDGQFEKILEGTKAQMKQLEVEREELSKKLGG
jgi:hypothetical protein